MYRKMSIDLIPYKIYRLASKLTNKKVDTSSDNSWFTMDGAHFSNGIHVATYGDDDGLFMHYHYLMEDKQIQAGDMVLRGRKVLEAVEQSGSIGYVGHNGYSFLYFNNNCSVIVATNDPKDSLKHLPRLGDLPEKHAFSSGHSRVAVALDDSGNILTNKGNIIYSKIILEFGKYDILGVAKILNEKSSFDKTDDELLDAIESIVYSKELTKIIKEHGKD